MGPWGGHQARPGVPPPHDSDSGSPRPEEGRPTERRGPDGSGPVPRTASSSLASLRPGGPPWLVRFGCSPWPVEGNSSEVRPEASRAVLCVVLHSESPTPVISGKRKASCIGWSVVGRQPASIGEVTRSPSGRRQDLTRMSIRAGPERPGTIRVFLGYEGPRGRASNSAGSGH